MAEESTLFKEGLGGAKGIFEIVAEKAGIPMGAPVEPEIVAGAIIQKALLVIGVIFGMLIIYGGYLWMTARGSEEVAKKAIEIIKNATIGFIIAVSAYAIASYVVEKVIEAALTTSP